MTAPDVHSGGSDGVGIGRESGLAQRLRRAYDALPLPRSNTLIVGYSGGADSLALLSALADLSATAGFSLRAVHVDHGARHDSAADRALAAAVTDSLGVPLVVKELAPGDIARHIGVGREEAMRRERYRVFADVAAVHVGAVIVLAHHERDQAETVLLHLLRGAGLRGVAGMRRLSAMRVPWWEGAVERTTVDLQVWRPLLGERAEAVRAYAESLGLPIAADASNADESYRRNAIRHSVLPVLERVAPGATGNLARFAALAGEDSDYLDDLARAELAQQGDLEMLGRAWLMGLALPIRRRVLHLWLGERAPAGLEVSLERIDAALRVAASPGPARSVELGRACAIEVTRDQLRLVVGGQPFT